MTKFIVYTLLFLPMFLFDKGTEISDKKLFFIPMEQNVRKKAAYQLKNEKVVYQLTMKNGKLLFICMDKNEKYIVYRFGSKNKIELEYPKEKDLSSFQKFEYSEYKRGGGIQNAAMELKYLAFINNGVKYVVYDTYFAEGNKTNAGIKVIESKDKITDLKGLKKSAKGNLFNLKNKVKQGD
ncbi:hypothetical protein MG290_07805 [Flavobacterium sp. CBA20B-1]|uniref:hypothetical protein n=1 Tax=unclassified Flavobacterium TaxID=196869 RepID=UPI0022257406|nr:MULTISPECIES: hypothetical protein [unclassified Flavobacterium]WCM40881.1 hypothetical protein MG290_07805 [Flavobacterium sp. CBA20B-1]